MRTGEIIVPDAIWDIPNKVCIDPVTHAPLPNYEGLCLMAHPHPVVMNTWLEGAERCWQVIKEGWCVKPQDLEAEIKKAS